MSMLDFFNEIEKLFGGLIDSKDDVKVKSNSDDGVKSCKSNDGEKCKNCKSCESCKSNGAEQRDNRFITIRYSGKDADKKVDVIGIDMNNQVELAGAIVAMIGGLSSMVAKATSIDEDEVNDELIDLVTKLTLKSIFKRWVSEDE